MLRDALRIGSVSGLSLQRTRCYRAVVVILLSVQEIAIASDGSRTLHTRAELLPVSKTVEKVTKLGSKLAFMCSGLVEIQTATVDIRPSEIARLRSV
jgi:hypothetical protein